MATDDPPDSPPDPHAPGIQPEGPQRQRYVLIGCTEEMVEEAREEMINRLEIEPRLSRRLSRLRGVTAARAAKLARLGLEQVRDVLIHFPREYKDFSGAHRLDSLVAGEHASVTGRVLDVGSRTTSGGRQMLVVTLACDGGRLRGVWFNMPFMARRFRPASRVVFAGAPRLAAGGWEMAHPEVRQLEGDEQSDTEWLPVYPLTAGVKQSDVRIAAAAAIDSVGDHLREAFLPEELEARRLLPIAEAFREIHRPTSRERLEAARRRFIYQELYMLQLALRVHRRQLETFVRAPVIELPSHLRSRIEGLFRFSFTAAQRRVVDEILSDLARPTPMQRLLQGDVGSGKTAVAASAMLAAVLTGHQAVLMAPTELLARQHFATLTELIRRRRLVAADGEPLKPRVELLIGGQGRGRRRRAAQRIETGVSQLIIGTQALLTADLKFANLGLVVIDEQHRFGVVQRSLLQGSLLQPHTLVMTATPIPRTVAHSLYGDLDLSTIDEVPPGRQPVATYRVGPAELDRWWSFFRRKLGEGRRGYVVVPAVEESARGLASVASVLEELANGPLEAFRLGLVHGRMAPETKQGVMESFRAGRLDVLVATSVVEVGIDVPEATLMTIMDADRFGLAQLHQLRGRVARGATRGICGAITESTESEHPRIDAFVGSTDGFQLAEIDLVLRGPGELLGTRQSGAPPLTVADIVRDGSLAAEAREHAIAVLAENPFLEGKPFARLRKLIGRRWGERLNLGAIG
jgi:ATP-dependent DNA helicase RecG